MLEKIATFEVALFPILSLTFNHTSWEAVTTLTDRPKSVFNQCVINGGVYILSCVFFRFFNGEVGCVIGLSQLSSFFSFHRLLLEKPWVVVLNTSAKHRKL